MIRSCHARARAGLGIALALLLATRSTGLAEPTVSAGERAPATLAARGYPQAQPGGGGLFTVRRGLGVAFLVGGAGMAMKGFDLRDEADAFYDRYKAATDEAEIEKYYQRTTNRDVKSQVSWALAAAFGITGMRLLFTGNDAGPSMALHPAQAPPVPAVSLATAVTPGAVGLRLRRSFY